MKGTTILFLLICLRLASFGQAYDFSNIIRLPDEINIKSELSKPYLMPDNQVLFFVNTVPDKGQEIWWCARDGKKWQPAAKFESLINQAKSNFIVGASYDNARMYVMNLINDRRMAGFELYEIGNNDGIWSDARQTSLPSLDITGKYMDAVISSDENYLLFSMENEYSYGKEDLFISIKQLNGSWSAPMNLGSDINTEASEIAPFLTDDGKTLFFATNGKGFGDYDIYMSRKIDNSWTHWTTPVNLGDKINSAKFDAYMMISNNNEAFFVSNRGGANSEIYTALFEIKPVFINTTPLASNPMEAKLLKAERLLNNVDSLQRSSGKNPKNFIKGTKKLIYIPGEKRYIYVNTPGKDYIENVTPINH